MSPSPTRAERLAPGVTAALLALPVLLAPFPPMLDLPAHAASVSVLRHFHDAALFPPGLYRLNLGHPNQLFHLSAWAISYVLPTVLACRVVVAAGVAAIPLAAARLADHLGASRWAAVVASPVALGWLFTYGLVANLLGLAAFLALLPALDRFVAAPTARGAWKVVGACVLLYLAHEAMLFVYAGTLLLFTALAPLRRRDTALRLAPFAFAVALTLAQLRYQATVMTESVRRFPTMTEPVTAKLVEIPDSLFSPWDPAQARTVFAVVVLAAAALVAARLRAPRSDAPSGLLARARALRFEVLAGASFAVYLAFPISINGANLMHQRFLAPAFVLAVLCASRGAPVSRLLPLLASLAPVSILLTSWPAFVRSSREHDDVLRLTERMAPGSAVAVIHLSDRPDLTESSFTSMAMLALVERGGRYLFSLAESPISPVMVTREHEWSEPVDRMVTRGEGLCPSYDLTRFRYVLLYSPSADLELATSLAMPPAGHFIAHAGFWALYESDRPRVSILAPDGPGPGPACPGGRLLERVAAAEQTLAARARAGLPAPSFPPP